MAVLEYKIPLWQHQKDIIALARKHPSIGIFAEMGTGKTAATINILRERFLEKKKILKTLVFCPPVVRTNWKREFALHSKVEKSVHVLEGSGKKRLDYFNDKINPDVFGRIPQDAIVVTNYESLLMEPLMKAFVEWGPEVLIFDEAHKLKSHKAQRTKLAIRLADLAEHKYVLTGTPILNTPMDLWALFRLIDGSETFDKKFIFFRAKYFYDKNAGMPAHVHFPLWQPVPGAYQEFNRLVYRKSIRVLKKDCLDLPPLVRKRVQVELSAEQARLYKSMKDHFIAYINDRAAVATIALTKILRLQQIVSGFLVDDEEKIIEIEDNPRLKALADILTEIPEGEKIIVWACFKDNYEKIKAVCDKLKMPWAMLVGGMPDKQRQKSIDDFQNDDTTRVIIANQQAGGVGLNLTAASYAVYYSRSYSLEADLQSEARNYRGGSEIHKSITRIDIVAEGTVDETILDALARKESIANQVLNKAKIVELL